MIKKEVFCMSELLEWMKNVYKSAKENQFNWKPIYPNNMQCNPIEGLVKQLKERLVPVVI